MRSTAATVEALSPAAREVLEGWREHVERELGRSAHTVRAYVGDVASLLDHAARMGHTDVRALDLAVLRSWLARQRTQGAARATLARRAAAARVFTAWAAKTGVLATDVGQRLVSPRVRASLPTVLTAPAGPLWCRPLAPVRRRVPAT